MAACDSVRGFSVGAVRVSGRVSALDADACDSVREGVVLDSGVVRDSLRGDGVRDSVREAVVLDSLPREVAVWLSGVARFDELRDSDLGEVFSVGAVRTVAPGRTVSRVGVRS